MRLLRQGLAVLLLCIPVAAYAITTNFTITVAINALNSVFSCSGFAATGSCGVIVGGGQTFGITGTQGSTPPGVTGSQVNLIPANSVHAALNLNYRTAAVNVQQFSTTFTYVPNGENLAFILSNCTISTCGGGNGYDFAGGASCEGSFFQGFTGGTAPPNNTFALQLDQFGSLTAGGSSFTYSSVQYYDTGHAPPNPPNAPGQSPCNPDLGGGGAGQGWTYVGVNKISTSPVALNSPANQINTITGHTYSATITYDGSNLNICLFDVTAANGTCTSGTTGTGTFFTNTWTGVSIPTIVGGNTAWVGLGGGTGSGGTQIPPFPLLINTWSYSSN